MAGQCLEASSKPHPPSFEYEILNHSEFRLIRFVIEEDGGVQDNENLICLEMKQVPLSDKPLYHALSYAWGNTARTWVILLNGATFHVTQNLGVALQRFERDRSLEWFWVDAVCINQNNDEETSQQVQNMRQIFENAQAVFAWLGRPVAGSVELMRSLQRESKRLIEHAWTRLQEDQGGAEELPNLDILPSNRLWPIFQPVVSLLNEHSIFSARIVTQLSLTSSHDGPFPPEIMLDFLRRQLWTRVWILQEFAVAQDLYLVCGEAKLKYIYFLVIYYLYFFLFYQDQGRNENLGERSIELADRVAALFPVFFHTTSAMKQQLSSPLQELLVSIYRLGATDPRDRIFALLGLSNDAQLLGIRADYSKSYSVMCVETAWRMLRQYGLWVLSKSSACRSTHHEEDLPSWVPDWSLPHVANLGVLRFDEAEFSASGASVMCTRPSIDNQNFESKVIEVSGTFVADISVIGSRAAFTVPRVTMSNFHAAVAFLADIGRLLVQVSETQSLTRETSWTQALWQIPIVHRKVAAISGEYQSAYHQKTAQLYHAYNVLRDEASVPSTITTTEDYNAWRLHECQLYLELLFENAHQKRSFACSGKPAYLGMGAENMKPGDRVCIFLGANVPYILRPQNNGRYKMVGEAYVYGLMHGEILDTNPVWDMIALE